MHGAISTLHHGHACHSAFDSISDKGSCALALALALLCWSAEQMGLGQQCWTERLPTVCGGDLVLARQMTLCSVCNENRQAMRKTLVISHQHKQLRICLP